MGDVVAATSRGRATAARLRAAAREVFAELGYTSARVEDIVTRAEVSHGTFYTYYENKARVLADLVAATAERLNQVAAAPWDDGPDVRATLERIIGEFLTVYTEESDVVGAWVEAAAVERDFARLLRELRGEFVERVAENLAPAALAGGHDPVAAASALVAMVEGYAIEHLGSRTAAPPAAVRTLTAIWHGGLQSLAEG